MFYNHKILNTNNEDILYLYTDSMYEFSKELDIDNKPRSIYDKVMQYIKDTDIKFNGKKVMLVINGLIIGSLTLVNNTDKKEQEYIIYRDALELDHYDNIDLIDISSNINAIKEDKKVNNDGFIISNFIKMKDKSGKTTFVDLNNYIINELSRYIPPTYEEEALKSASIVVRTNIFRELYENNYLNGDTYRSNYELQKLWGKKFQYYFQKLKSAVEETSYQYLSHHNYYFNFNTRDQYQVPYNAYHANMLAKSGYQYLDILGHFYPDASIEIA